MFATAPELRLTRTAIQSSVTCAKAQAALDQMDFPYRMKWKDEPRMDDLPDPKRMAPLRADPMQKAGDGWPVVWTTGNSQEDGEDWCIQTDYVHASELLETDFPCDAKYDAQAIVAIVNAYREGRLIPAK